MRRQLRRHSPIAAAFVVFLLVASILAVVMPPPGTQARPVRLLPGPLVELPKDDRDGDTYADGIDLVVGDLVLRIGLHHPTPREVLIGTDDDHLRFGKGRALEWQRILDFAPDGRPGSPAWEADVVRTGTWLTTRSDDWPDQTLFLDVREDRNLISFVVEERDARATAHLVFDLRDGSLRQRDGETAVAGGSLALTSGLLVTAEAATKYDGRAVADRWAPTLHLAPDEDFYPVDGTLLERFHGFSRREPDLRTWDRSFNNGRDDYRLLLADFDGDRLVTHEDAALMAEILAAGPLGAPTVHHAVHEVQGGRIVVQYWFLYLYNFVLDETDRDIEALAHAGDREFMQLVFADRTAAEQGLPLEVHYSQHYEGIRILGPDVGQAPFAEGRPQVYVARGSHASYPVPGDDQALRPAFTGYFDAFPGGTTLTPEDYRLVELGNQTWHAGYLWGPATRYIRDMGTSVRPFLQHDFRYPWMDPLHYADALLEIEQEGMTRMYGGS